ncbi:ABC transporter permease [Peribacillus tepidiphilus]|uniref:ABC transporter permease n=1 Tax=Peribacillus tepidiphilus TaxID=2652445 RepID=UPI0030B85AC9
MFFNLMTGTATFYIFTGNIFSKEYQGGTQIILLTSPIPKIKFYAGKLFTVLGFIFIAMLIVLFLPFILGILITDLPFTFNFFFAQLKVVSLMGIMHFGLIPIASFCAIKWVPLRSSIALFSFIFQYYACKRTMECTISMGNSSFI